MASKRFYINRKVKKTLKKDINIKIGDTRESSQSIQQIVDEQVLHAL